METSPEHRAHLLVTEAAFVQVLMREIDLKGEIGYAQFDQLTQLATELVGTIHRRAHCHALRIPRRHRDLWNWVVGRLERANMVLPCRVESVTAELMRLARRRLHLPH